MTKGIKRPDLFSKRTYRAYPRHKEISAGLFKKILNELGNVRGEFLIKDRILFLANFGRYRIITRKRVTKDRVLKVIDWKKTVQYRKETGDNDMLIYKDDDEFNFLRFDKFKKIKNIGYYSVYTNSDVTKNSFNTTDTLKYDK